MSIDGGKRSAAVRRLLTEAFARHRQLVLFLLVGILNTVVGYGLFALLFLFTGSHRVSLVVATVLGVMFNFCSTGRMVFGNRSFKALFPFVAGYAVTLGLNFVLLEVLAQAGLNPLIAQGACLPVIVILGYLINSRIVFRSKTA